MRNLLSLPTIGGIGNYHHHQIESGTPCTVAELSEAEFDIDTLKKLKLGMRSSLWSRPNMSASNNGEHNENNQNLNANNQMRHAIEASSNPSDYSIAV